MFIIMFTFPEPASNYYMFIIMFTFTEPAINYYMFIIMFTFQGSAINYYMLIIMSTFPEPAINYFMQPMKRKKAVKQKHINQPRPPCRCKQKRVKSHLVFKMPKGTWDIFRELAFFTGRGAVCLWRVPIFWGVL